MAKKIKYKNGQPCQHGKNLINKYKFTIIQVADLYNVQHMVRGFLILLARAPYNMI